MFVFSLVSCSSSSPLELVNANVKIVQDEKLVGAIGITEGEREGEELVPTALYYEFTIKNTNNNTVGSEEVAKGIEIKIVPKDKLKSVSEEVIGFNIYNSAEYDASGVGFGTTYSTILSSNEEAEYSLHYDLGVSEENPTVPLLVPSKDKLDKLKNAAFNAFLVVTIENEEVARFDLDTFQKRID